jgi:hypothetical protein
MHKQSSQRLGDKYKYKYKSFAYLEYLYGTIVQCQVKIGQKTYSGKTV